MSLLARPTLGAVALVLLSCIPAAFARHHTHTQAEQKPVATATDAYDYFVMALSWSPTYCQTHATDDDQCNHRGYGFVLHGLWPQFQDGGGPQRCATDREPDRATVARTLAFMPSKRLIEHEWKAHGACTGLDPASYFNAADRAFAALEVPPELKAPQRPIQSRADELRGALKRVNPALGDDMLSLHCSQGELVELRVCLSKDLQLRSCGKRMRSGCPASATFTIPATD